MDIVAYALELLNQGRNPEKRGYVTADDIVVKKVTERQDRRFGAPTGALRPEIAVRFKTTGSIVYLPYPEGEPAPAVAGTPTRHPGEPMSPPAGDVDLDALGYTELKALAKARGLSAKGTAPTIRARLQGKET